MKSRLIQAFPDQEWETVMNTINRELIPGHELEYASKSLSRYRFIFREWWLYSNTGFLFKKSTFYQKITRDYKTLYRNNVHFVLIATLAMLMCLAIFRREIHWLILVPGYAIFYTATISSLGTYDEWFRMLTPVRSLIYVWGLLLVWEVGSNLVKKFLCRFRFN